MRPKQVIDALVALIPTQRPLYLWGPPGVGKSSIIHQAAEKLELEVCDLRAVLLDPVDLRGLPTVNKGQAQWLPPSFLPTQGKGLLFLDELAQAPPLVQAACLQLTLDRRVGEYTLPAGWSLVAASNRQEDRAGAHRLITPLLNRFIHLDLEVSNEDWRNWAMESGISLHLISFLELQPTLLHQFDPASGARAFPTPRSWQFVSDILQTTPTTLRHSVFAGCVGDGPAADFCGFLEYADKLPKLDEILAKPSTFKTFTEPSICFALAGALADKCRDPQHHDAVAQYVSRWQPEFATWAMRLCTATGRQPFTRTKAAAQWMQKNYHLLAAQPAA